MAVEFFAPVDSFAIGGAWVINGGGSPQKEHSFARALGNDGDEIASAEYDSKETVTCSYICTATDGNLSIPKVGEIKNGYHIDSVNITWSQTEFPTMEVSGHKHLQGDPDSGCRTYSTKLVIPASGVGIPNEITGAYKLDVLAKCGMRGLTYSLTTNHIDEANCRGGHLAGDNHDGSETLDIELTGNIPASMLGIGADWDVESEGITQSNTEATTSAYSITRHLAHDEQSPVLGA